MKLSALVALLPATIHAATSSTPAAPWPTHSFHTTPKTAPLLNVTKVGQTEPGFLFISPSTQNLGSPTIYSDNGDLVWLGPEGGKTFAYQPQYLHGEPVLTFWQGNTGKGFGYGHVSVLNASYDEIHRVTLPSTPSNKFVMPTNESYPSNVDIHESTITENGTILVMAVNITQTDLSPVGGPKNGWAQDGIIYEIDIETNEILFRWSAVEHKKQLPLDLVEYPIEDTGTSRSNAYEYPHLNSIAKYGDNYLVSSRYMCSVFLLDKDGNVIWLFHGQKGGTFNAPTNPDAKFCYQHDARIHSHLNAGQKNESLLLSLHNNANVETTVHKKTTTDLRFMLYPGNNTARLVSRTFDREQPISAVSQGNYQSLARNGSGHYLAGHGSVAKFEEYDASGKLVMRGWFSNLNATTGKYAQTSYRAYRAQWTGKPRSVPDVVACKPARSEGGKVQVYVSWNGATDVAQWKILGGSKGEKVLDLVEKKGFETGVVVDVGFEEVGAIVVEALGGVGDGVRSKPARVRSCSSI
ncbi:hypothetical protein ASPVEDRAFT_120084 [Aspergillus versicolor CBS 583.65]|uniref:ASST-domain-containing protein n=1 Tax=Aspergillus versicolor CBS 583.65 TaxID=1036611 RepID=A0A1L9P3V7_ASPVE|nr:uncharacterized protein ASPVEDRAFT_120084 [Aspergillus versicolor CBS 583.65]OJI96199.1 hypothetical protein ASPVEDRAFT_120084 [Aspergillus versicolor CBS 583.65]